MYIFYCTYTVMQNQYLCLNWIDWLIENLNEEKIYFSNLYCWPYYAKMIITVEAPVCCMDDLMTFWNIFKKILKLILKPSYKASQLSLKNICWHQNTPMHFVLITNDYVYCLVIKQSLLYKSFMIPYAMQAVIKCCQLLK